jgi:ribonucleoside-diphosphate reductase subunit M2
MAAQLTPSKQAASSLENLKMSDSPIKKLDFQSAGKENVASFKPTDAPVDKMGDKIVEAPKVASGIKETEANEPLLQENPHRFVLFPIKYHEVCHVADASMFTRKVA